MTEGIDPRGVKAALEERGWALLPAVIEPARCQETLARLETLWAELGQPPLYSRQDQLLRPTAIVSPVGLVLLDLLQRFPDARDLLLPAEVIAVAHEALGPGFQLENAAGILTDHTRPFFFWHHHLGGIIEARDYRKLENRYPVFDRIRRLSCTFYPSPLDEEHGLMLVHPRRLSEPTNPPFADMDHPWPGQQIVRCPAGSVLLLEQCLWHAVTPMQQPGRRAFVAGFLAAPGTAPAAP